MGQVSPAPPAKLFVAMLVASDGRERLGEFDVALAESFGGIDLVSSTWPFVETAYYTAEMGADLIRRVVSFAGVFDPGELPGAKRRTNALERELTGRFREPGAGRIVNFDAGYLTLGQVVLATTKSYSHRVYLGDEIWGEVTLRYFKGRYEKWDWTYPDYASGRYNDFWMQMRETLKHESAGRQDDG